MNELDILRGIEAQRDAALIGHHQDAYSRAIEARDRLTHAGQKFKILPPGDVLAFRPLTVDDAVAVEEGGANAGPVRISRKSFFRWSVHAPMIATC